MRGGGIPDSVERDTCGGTKLRGFVKILVNGGIPPLLSTRRNAACLKVLIKLAFIPNNFKWCLECASETLSLTGCLLQNSRL